MGARMVGEVLILLDNLGLERRQFRVPGVPHFLGTHGMTPQHVSDTLFCEHLGQLLIEELQLKGPYAQQFFNLWFGNGGNVMAPVLHEVFDLLALDHATVADEGDLCNTKPALDLLKLRSKGARVLRIAWKHFNGDRMAVLVAE